MIVCYLFSEIQQVAFCPVSQYCMVLNKYQDNLTDLFYDQKTFLPLVSLDTGSHETGFDGFFFRHKGKSIVKPKANHSMQ